MTDVVEPIPGVEAATTRRPARGYALYLGAAVLFALNGTVAKTLLLSGIEATRLSQLRVTLAFLILLVFVALTNRAALRVRRAEVPLLLVYGVLGIALAQFFYYLSIERLPIGIALLIACRIRRHGSDRAAMANVLSAWMVVGLAQAAEASGQGARAAVLKPLRGALPAGTYTPDSAMIRPVSMASRRRAWSAVVCAA